MLAQSSAFAGSSRNTNWIAGSIQRAIENEFRRLFDIACTGLPYNLILCGPSIRATCMSNMGRSNFKCWNVLKRRHPSNYGQRLQNTVGTINGRRCKYNSKSALCDNQRLLIYHVAGMDGLHVYSNVRSFERVRLEFSFLF